MESRRPTLWIVLTCVFALGAIGLGIWAMSAQSDADDAKAALATAEQAAERGDSDAGPDGGGGPAPPGRPGDAASYKEAEAELRHRLRGCRADPVRAGAAAANAEQARQKAADATGAVDKLRAEADAFKAQAELTKTCLKGTLGALDQAAQSGGLEAATEQLKALAGQCKNATAS